MRLSTNQSQLCYAGWPADKCPEVVVFGAEQHMPWYVHANCNAEGLPEPQLPATI